MSSYQKPFPRRAGTITAIVQGIATITLDAGGTVPMHPSAWKSGHTDDAIYRVGDRVEVSSSGEAVWRE